ncbi:hypothetical protein PV08_07178 [Exophiala spinifera]|uniref:Uncharacterized protein n=1 Tax=Exophiala spinifera TaxID=91928 RepID=A0A0D1YHJ5_9EURO|nr:uncharacterized protein PV08_07178 [Exophiala spinifera]KIW14396.1 hypothetical protein PV08_07178 [Exophiala spinifera]
MSVSDERSYFTRIEGAIMADAAAKVEAECARAVERSLPNFIMSMEKASVDCGLLVDGAISNSDLAERVIEANRVYGGTKKLIPLDIKHIRPTLSRSSTAGGYYNYRIHCMPMQKVVPAFIVQNPIAPEYVAVIPHWYLDRDWPPRSKPTKFHTYHSLDIALVGPYYTAFPPEWVPFVMPLDRLHDALQSLQNYATGVGGANWKNPYSGVEFDHCPRPRLEPVRLTLPQDGIASDHDDILAIHRALEKYSQSYQVRLPRTKPGAGDFYIERCDKRRLIVELKRDEVKHMDNGDIHIQYIKQRRVRKKSFLDPLSQWNLLFVLTKTPSRLFVFARDELPEDWFQLDPRQTAEAVLQHGYLNLTDHEVQWNRGTERAVQTLEKFLDRYICRADSTSTQPRSQGKVLTPELRRNLLGHLPEEEDHPPAGTLTGANKISQNPSRRWSRRLWEARQMRWLVGECEKRHFGLVYVLGHAHPSGTHLFVPIPLDTMSKRPDLHELSPDTPVLFLNFAPLDEMAWRVPTDHRRPNCYLKATHGSTPSMFVLCGVEEAVDTYQHGRYLVPSTTLASEQQIEHHENIILNGMSNMGKQTPVYLSHGEMIDTYRLSEDDVVPRLRRVSEEFQNERHLYMGRPLTAAGVTVDLEAFITNLRTVNQQWIRYLSRDIDERLIKLEAKD